MKHEPIHVDPIQKVFDHVEKLNKLGWVIASGWPYFVGQRDKPSGGIEHFVARNDHREETQTPSKTGTY